MVQINQKWNCFANCKYNFSKQAGAMHALLNDDKKMNQWNDNEYNIK